MKVICVNKGNNIHLTEGRIYEVLQETNFWGYSAYIIENDNGVEHEYRCKRFEIMEEEQVKVDKNGNILRINDKVTLGELQGVITGFEDNTIIISTEYFKAHIKACDVVKIDPIKDKFKELNKSISELGFKLDTDYEWFKEKCFFEGALLYVNSYDFEETNWNLTNIICLKDWLNEVISLAENIRQAK